MSTDTLIILAGTLTALVSLSGFPSSWKDWMVLILGVFVIALGIVVRRRGKKMVPGGLKRPRRKGFVESMPTDIDPIVHTESVLAREDRNEND